ncbi:MAG: VOC family protein [Hyphomicrobiales bacterium]|nr:VOC family protein [Hyphomicrobiales bacterium]
MFDHLEFAVADIEAARRFYGSIYDAIGGCEVFYDQDNKSCGFGTSDIVHLLLTEATATTPRLHFCFTAQSKHDVERAYLAALSSGGVCNGKPGYRDHYSAGYFAAFVLDPDGHNVEILHREQS